MLYVPSITKNLISISALCVTNRVNVLFFYSFFQVQDRHTGTTLVQGDRKDGIYMWPKCAMCRSSALVLSSSVKYNDSVFTWHCHLGHPSLAIFRKMLSSLRVFFPLHKLANFSCNSCHINKSHKLPFSNSPISSSLPLEVIFSDLRSSRSPLLMGLNTTSYLLIIY